MALVHRRHAGRVSTRGAVERYLEVCGRQTRSEHFALPPSMADFRVEANDEISWRSDAESVREFPANGRARALLFRINKTAPTVIMLHALMSASDTGYRLWASRFNALGWNAAFMHLPFHYSRRPRGHLNGELCCTSNLVLTGDTLRQAVVDVRQLGGFLREEGSSGLALLGMSYGGWVAAIAASLEPDLRFLTLLAPLVDISHALFEGPTSWTIRGQLEAAGLDRALVARHAHLSSPAREKPAGDAATRTLLLAGEFDSIVRPADLAVVRDAWPGADLISVPQAHFGYAMFPRTMRWLEDRGLLVA
jgi:pimeloyl-ACP methyl ester carboxylesterase